MNNYREQVTISCATCLHSYDVEFYESEALMCVEDLPISAKTLYRFYSHSDEDIIIHNELARWRSLIYDDPTRHVSASGICDNYEQK